MRTHPYVVSDIRSGSYYIPVRYTKIDITFD